MNLNSARKRTLSKKKKEVSFCLCYGNLKEGRIGGMYQTAIGRETIHIGFNYSG